MPVSIGSQQFAHFALGAASLGDMIWRYVNSGGPNDTADRHQWHTQDNSPEAI